MWKRKQQHGENITSYMEQLWNATGIDIPDEIKLSQFIGGLKLPIQGLVNAQNLQTINMSISSRVSKPAVLCYMSVLSATRTLLIGPFSLESLPLYWLVLSGS